MIVMDFSYRLSSGCGGGELFIANKNTHFCCYSGRDLSNWQKLSIESGDIESIRWVRSRTYSKPLHEGVVALG